MTVVSMSAKEFSRLDVLMDLEARRVTVRDACGLLRLKRRQVFRLLKDFRAHGAASLDLEAAWQTWQQPPASAGP